EVSEELYGEENSMFKELTASYSNDRSDAGLTDLIFSLYDLARANPHPDTWLNQLGDLYMVEDDQLTHGTLYQHLLKPQLIDILENLVELALAAVKIGESSDELDKQREIATQEASLFNQLLEGIRADQYEQVFEQCRSFVFDRWKAAKRSADEDIKEAAGEMKVFRDQYKNRFQEMKEHYFSASAADQVERMKKTLPLIQEMARVTRLFTQAYTERKRERHVLDFIDL